jgi:hypothetical protein
MYRDIWDDEPGDEPGDGPLSAWDALLLHARATGDVAVVGARTWGCSPQYAYTFGLTAYGHRHLLVVPVADPTALISVQEHFAGPGREPVAALQIVWADQEGNWPWEVGWLGEPQELFGAPAGVTV